MSEQIRVAVQGALGRMGQEILATLAKEPDMLPVGGADHFAKGDTLALPGASGTIPLSTSLADVIADADVVVDFTNGEGAADAIDTVPASGKHLVIGSTGIPADAIERAEKLAAEHNVGIFIAPNFTIGVAVMMHLVTGGRAVLRLRRSPRDPSRGENRRAVRYGSRHRGGGCRGEGRHLQRPRGGEGACCRNARRRTRRGGHPFRPNAGQGCPPRDGLRPRRPDALHQTRFDKPRELHARCHARHPRD